ncbi:MAG: ATP-binding protein [Methanocorpusculum sp.]|nr:ATP-binding protein [Methanocorpusculum sp.]
MTPPAHLLHSLVLFRSLLHLPVYQKLLALLDDDHTDTTRFLDRYAEFVAELYRHTDNLSEYIQTTVYEDDNIYVRLVAEEKTIPAVIADTLHAELRALETLSRLTPADLKGTYRDCLPSWQTKEIDLIRGYAERMATIHTTGYGIFAAHHTFIIKNATITPLQHPDPQKLSDLYGYTAERRKIIANTEALLAGKPSVNVLLYGDAGTGKSSTIKAIANEYAACGLRLIEIKKSQLHLIPSIIEQLAANPLKFILFIDDLTFTETDNEFASLKAILEGSAAARTKNIVVYATSNRRHLMKETFSGREGDDVHRNDTLEETLSLSARFGIIITFQKPGTDAYLEIVNSLAREYEISIQEDQLHAGAEMYALRAGGRTPRAAKQYIELLAANTL